MAIDPVFGAESDWYWSSTSYAGLPGYAWYVYFYDGNGGYVGGGGYVRAVRCGP